MAMFLSRIKKALNLGTKNITINGTYNASSDGYDGYSSVEVNVAGVTPTPITPSNASPAALTSGDAVTPTANGYAIASYDSVTPSSTPESVASGDIVKIGGSGVIVDSIPTPTSITPSNSSPVALTANTPVKPSASGYAISSYSEVAPSNANPPEIYNGGIYKIKTRNGYLISTVNIVAPSDSNPPLLSNDNSWYRLNGASGYLYHTVQPKVKTGTFTPNQSSPTSVNIGFQPKYLCVMTHANSSSNFQIFIYNQSVSTTKFLYASPQTYLKYYDLGLTSAYRLKSIDSNGFTLTQFTSTSWIGSDSYYFAIG